MNNNRALATRKRYNMYTFSVALFGFMCIPSSIITCAGILDACFNSAGIVPGTLKTNFSESPLANAAAIQSDGKIVVAGNLSNNLLLVRYNVGGALDTTFNGTGIVITPVQNYSSASTIAIQSDGKIVVAGLSDLYLLVARYNSDGSLDSTFNGTGIVTTSSAELPPLLAESIALQGDKIVITGLLIVEGNTEFALVRYNSNGSLDTTFNSASEHPGFLRTQVGRFGAGSHSVAIDNNGSIVVSGGADGNFALARYTYSGVLDTTFNKTGIVKSNVAVQGSKVQIQTDGKIIAGVSSIDPEVFTVIRYNSDGTLDAKFNSKGATPGMVTTPVADAVTTKSLMLEKNGKIIVAGFASGTPDQFALVRYNANGTLDKSFNGGGIQSGIATMHVEGAVCTAAALGWDGKIVLVGNSNQEKEHFIVVARYN